MTKKDGNTFWGHSDYNAHKDNCKQSYSTIEDIEVDREKRIKVLENEQNISIIDQVKKEDLFQNIPMTKIKINSNTIAVLKQCIDEWS